MTGEEVAQLVREEIGEDWSHPNPHGVDLRESLVAPQKVRLFVDMDTDRQVEHWLVLEESARRGGYLIVFDEDSRRFGLATFDVTTKRCYFLGLYGSFLETLDAM